MQTPAIMLSLLLGCTGDKNSSVTDDTGTPASDDTGTETALYTVLDDVLEPIRIDYGLPSLTAAVVEGSTLTKLGAVGLRSLDAKVEVTHEDRYHLGSCTKAMTATLTAVLVENGTLSWETTLAEAFPDITPHADYESVTLEMLLAHVGGTWSSLGEHPDVWGELWESGDVVEQRAWFAEQVLAEGPEVTPGTQYLYSNTGYMLVGAAMEAVTGESWEALMQVHLLDPLEMTSCGFGAPDPDGNLSHPWGHSSGAPVDGSSLYADNPRALGPAGTVHCSMTDWGKFASAHLAGARGESSYLGEDSFTRMHTPVLSDYALGWSVAVRSWAGETPALTHTGTNSMFYSNIWLAPDINTAFLTATNQGDSSSALDETIGTLIGL